MDVKIFLTTVVTILDENCYNTRIKLVTLFLAVVACESFCSLPSDVSKTSVQEATSGVDVDLTEFDEPWPEQQQTDSCGKCNSIKY